MKKPKSIVGSSPKSKEEVGGRGRGTGGGLKPLGAQRRAAVPQTTVPRDEPMSTTVPRDVT